MTRGCPVNRMAERHAIDVVDLAAWGEDVEIDDDTPIGVRAYLAFHVTDGIVTLELASELGAKRVLTPLESLRTALRDAEIVP